MSLLRRRELSFGMHEYVMIICMCHCHYNILVAPTKDDLNLKKPLILASFNFSWSEIDWSVHGFAFTPRPFLVGNKKIHFEKVLPFLLWDSSCAQLRRTIAEIPPFLQVLFTSTVWRQFGGTGGGAGVERIVNNLWCQSANRLKEKSKGSLPLPRCGQGTIYFSQWM